jgi:hypothetical protein
MLPALIRLKLGTRAAASTTGPSMEIPPVCVLSPTTKVGVEIEMRSAALKSKDVSSLPRPRLTARDRVSDLITTRPPPWVSTVPGTPLDPPRLSRSVTNTSSAPADLTEPSTRTPTASAAADCTTPLILA